MKGIYGITGLAVLCAGLAGWAALSWAQTAPGKLPPADAPMNDPGLQVGAPGSTLPPVSGPTPGQAVPYGTSPAPSGYSPPGSVPAPTPNPAAGDENPLRGSRGMRDRGVTPASATEPGIGEPVSDPATAASKENPTGRQEPAVSLEWIGPATAKVGQPADYTVAIRSACNIPLQQVMVRVRIPAGMTVAATEPKALAEDNVLLWDLGTLMPRQEKNLQVKLVATSKGDIGCMAWVTFTGSSSLNIRVREPKLVLKATAPDKVLVGDAATFMLAVSNPGDGPADAVKIHATLSEGLEYVRGNQTDFDIGTVPPGETRSVQVVCATKAPGVQTCDAIAEADGGLKSPDRATVNVIMPNLELQAAGPKLRYLDRKAIYTFKVTNPGDASATNVTVSDTIPQGFKFVGASDGGRHDFATRTVSWFLGEVGPGQSKEVKLEVVAVNPGEHVHKAAAVAARGLKKDTEIMTRVEGLSAILLEVVDTEDPVEVGADTTYEIRITNTGSKTETDIKVVCTIPDKMQYKGSQGPSRGHEEGRDIVFDPLPKLAPRADAIYRVNVKAIGAGDVRFKTRITSTNLVEPVHEEESTRIYED
jgi:uncharacterized repeat protein (TIGR01451 family)